MKELSIEEKAKAYDSNYKAYTELINRLEDMKEAIKKQNYGIAMDILCKPYPEFQITASTELKERDERIRQFLIHEVTETSDKIMSYRNMNKKDVLAWLEKQGEQKPTDKAESKFHEGDWVVISTSDGEKVVQIDSIEYFKSGEPRYITSEGRWFGNGTKAHLWTIQDAKDGDVLFQDLMCGKTFIYNGVNPDMAILYSFIISNDGKDVLPYHIWKPNTGIGNIEENKNIIYPATKEQRDLLFQKIKEAGYEWDAEKKELKKIEQKPTAWSEKVDLEKELNIWRHNHFHGRRDKEASGEYLKRNSQLDLAKYFFELGLKVKKENKL